MLEKWNLFLCSLWKCPCVFCIERWLRRGDWPKILCEGVWVWCGEELWVSNTGKYLCYGSLSLSLFLFSFSSLLVLLISVNHTRSPFLLLFSCHSVFMTHISVTISSFPVSLSVILVFLYRFHLIPVLSHLCPSNLFSPFFCSPDAGGRIHAVCHDSWDQAELDRGFKEVYPAQQLPRPHTVIANWIVNIKAWI